MSTLFLEPIAGIAGDMFVAAFLDADLVSPEELRTLPEKLGLIDVNIELRKEQRAGISGTVIKITWGDTTLDAITGASGTADHHSHIHYTSIVNLINESDLDDDTKTIALDILGHLARAEAEVHGVPLSEVGFHEVGDVDSIMDVVMAGYCLAKIGANKVVSTPVKLGRGTVEIQHGTYPVPPPATTLMIRGMPVDSVPDAIPDENVELSTPTGMAIMKSLQPNFVSGWQGGTLLYVGNGCGHRQFDSYPNIFRISVFEDETDDAPGMQSLPYIDGTIVEMKCNIDDQTPERSAWALQEVMNRGALDAWFIPVTGKKNRPAVVFTVLATEEDAPRISDWILRHTSTFGIRYSINSKLELKRRIEERQTDFGAVRYKIGMTTENEDLKSKPEFDDLEKIWQQHPNYHPEDENN
ncbi:MAG: nickel pincer cofactor biosynthesis protein LarC [Candidatus Marinimicrobia bacterium]|nr:nickel pincer cofactor biosynthesis protein LarC [Candidatus Neomarinimicrobiota bacterium]MCF7880475.1 nickel pincer cofactor biosynthesis protein LarC [Candidatus Neomarinimicrobiota bacterium]